MPTAEQKRTQALTKAAAKYIAPLDEGELTVILVEAIAEIARPEGMTVAQVLISIPDDDRIAFAKGARAAIMYFKRQIEAAASVQ